MKITICGSSTFRDKMIEYREELKKLWHEPVVHPDYEAMVKWEKPELLKQIEKEHADVKKRYKFIKWYYDAIVSSDAILVLNFDKNWISNYIWGNTLMEIGFAHVHGKKIFLLHSVPEISYKDEILAMYDVILNWDLDNLK